MNFFSSKTKTHADVLKDLIEQIYKASISLLSPPEEPEPSPTIDDLQSVFSHWASQSFTSNFGYEHQGEHSNPPEEAPMSGSLDAYNAFCDIYDEDDKQEKLDFFLDALFSGIQTLPGEALADISSECQALLARPPANVGTATTFSKVYPSITDKYENSLRIDGVFIHVNGSMTERKVTATCSAITCLGVCYRVVSDAKKAKAALWSSLCSSANDMLQNKISLSTPPTIPELNSIMSLQRDYRFPNDFGYSYEDDDSVPEGSTRASHLFIFEDGDFSDLRNQLRDQIISGLTLPENLEDKVTSTLLDDLEREIDLGPETRINWTPYKVDRTHSPNISTEPNLIENAEIVRCHPLSSEHVNVSWCCLFYSAVFYRITSSKGSAKRELILKLCKAGKILLRRQMNFPSDPTKADLDKILLAVCDEQFSKNFGFEYRGKDSEPRDMGPEPNPPIYACKAQFSVEKVGDSSAAKFVEQIMRNWPDILNDRSLSESIRSDLITQVQRCFDGTMSPNEFHDSKIDVDARYNYGTQDRLPLGTKSLFLYCDGSTTSPVGEHAFTATLHVIYYIGMYYPMDIVAEW